MGEIHNVMLLWINIHQMRSVPPPASDCPLRPSSSPTPPHFLYICLLAHGLVDRLGIESIGEEFDPVDQPRARLI